MAVQVGVNSYVTLDEAEQYFSERLYTDEWDNADAITKEKALITACRRIERLTFKGLKVDETQILSFPRMYPNVGTPVSKERGFNLDFSIGFIEQEDVPQEVKNAQCEEALALLKYGNSTRAKLQEQNVVKVDFGSVSEEYKGLGKLFSKEAYELLKPYIAGPVAII